MARLFPGGGGLAFLFCLLVLGGVWIVGWQVWEMLYSLAVMMSWYTSGMILN